MPLERAAFEFVAACFHLFLELLNLDLLVEFGPAFGASDFDLSFNKFLARGGFAGKSNRRPSRS